MTKTFGMVSGVPGATKMAGGAGHTLILTTPLIQLAAITVQPTIVKGGAAVTGTITLNGVAGPGGQRVYLAYYSVDQNGVYVNAATGPAYVDVSPTSKTATFTIRTKAVATKTITTINGWLNQSLNTTFTITP